MYNTVDAKEEKKGKRYTKQIIVGNYSQNCHLDKARLEAFFKSKLPVKDLLISHESADAECPHIHTHFVIVLNKVHEFNVAKYLDFEGYHPWIDLRAGVCMKNLRDHWNYICKEDNKDRLMAEKKNIVESMLNCKRGDEVAMCSKMGEVIPAMAIAAAKKRVVKKTTSVVLEKMWQVDLARWCLWKANRRDVTWYTDLVGGSGKSTFCDWLVEYRGHDWVILNGGNMKDVATTLEGAFDHGWTGWGVVIDLPRSKEGFDKGIYQVIESLKNGRVQVTKYKGGVVELPAPCHVIVFANYDPDWHMLSKDRWIHNTLRGWDKELGAFLEPVEIVNPIEKDLRLHFPKVIAAEIYGYTKRGLWDDDNFYSP